MRETCVYCGGRLHQDLVNKQWKHCEVCAPVWYENNCIPKPVFDISLKDRGKPNRPSYV